MANFQADNNRASQQQQKVSPDSIFYQFSPEETKVIKECNRESFVQRSLPLSAIFGAASYIGVSAGYFKPSPKWGPWPKVVCGGLLGYLIGKYSYQSKCAEKLMQIPNSEIGRVLRERRGKMQSDSYNGNVLGPSIISGTSSSDTQSFSTDYKSDMNFDLNTSMNSLDTDYRPDYDDVSSNKTNDIPMSNFNSSTSYDELRSRNRQEYERTQPNKPTYRSPSNNQLIWDNQPHPPADQIRYPQPKEFRNQYGDTF